MTDFEEQGGRLKELVAALRLTQSSLAQRIGVSRGYVSLLVKGEKPMSQAVLNGLAKSFPKANIHWLLTGEGEMFFEKSSALEKGLLTGVMEPEEEQPYMKGEGRLEKMERRIAELEKWRKELEGKE